MSALVIGESLVDVISGVAVPGGSPMNVAVGLARLGREVRLATWFGRDEYGALIREYLAASGVELVVGSDGAVRTSSAEVVFGSGGAARYLFDIDWHVPEVVVGGVVVGEGVLPEIVHVGSLGAVLAPGGSRVLELAREFAGVGVAVSFDPNCRPGVMGAVSDVRRIVEDYVSVARVVKVSDEDLQWLYPGCVEEGVASQWAAEGPGLVVLTRGAAGAVGFSGQACVRVAAPEVAVVDTVGAGDAFMSGLLHQLWADGWLNSGGSLDEGSLSRVMNVATNAAGVALSRRGADPPWLSELA